MGDDARPRSRGGAGGVGRGMSGAVDRSGGNVVQLGPRRARAGRRSARPARCPDARVAAILAGWHPLDHAGGRRPERRSAWARIADIVIAVVRGG